MDNEDSACGIFVGNQNPEGAVRGRNKTYRDLKTCCGETRQILKTDDRRSSFTSIINETCDAIIGTRSPSRFVGVLAVEPLL
jgi:hypothetical protein